MKKLLLPLILIATAKIQAQSVGEKVTLEASYGFNAPVSPTEDWRGAAMEPSDYAGINNLQLGFTYKINEDWGVRGTYMLANFKNKDVENLGTTIHKLTLEGVYTIYNSTLSQNYTAGSNGFALYAHAGLGLGISESNFSSSKDFLANAQVGLKPTYHLNDRWSVFLNPVYVMNFSQHIGFDGRHITQNSEASVGSFYTVNLGVSVRLGK